MLTDWLLKAYLTHLGTAGIHRLQHYFMRLNTWTIFDTYKIPSSVSLQTTQASTITTLKKTSTALASRLSRPWKRILEISRQRSMIPETSSMNVIRKRTLVFSFALSMSKLMRNEAWLVRRIDEFLDAISGIESEDGKKRIGLFNYATFNGILWRLLRFTMQWATSLVVFLRLLIKLGACSLKDHRYY